VAAEALAAGMGVTAHNLGVRGETSVQIAARWRGESDPHLLAQGQMGIVLSFGVNDTTMENGRERVAAERSRKALGVILDEAEAMGLRALVVGPAPIDDPEQNRRIGDLSDSFAEICAEHGAPFIDVFELLLASPVWMAEVRAEDGAHPSSEGYRVLSQVVLGAGFLDWLGADG